MSSSQPTNGPQKSEVIKHLEEVLTTQVSDSCPETNASPTNPEGVKRTQAGVPTPDINGNINHSPEGAKEQKNNMASSLAKISIHLIFHIKAAGVDLRNEDLPRIFRYIGGIITGLGGIPIEIGGTTNHVHILTSLPKTIALTDYVRQIKANSSKWIKQLDIQYAQFAWQDGYGAFSVSPSIIDKTIQYIRGQEEHHKTRSFKEEYRLFLDAYGIEYDEKYAFSD